LFGNYAAQWWCRGLDEPTRDYIANGQTYLNFHTQQHPGGEIRGQLHEGYGDPRYGGTLLVYVAENIESGSNARGLSEIYHGGGDTFELFLDVYYEGVSSEVTEVGVFNQERDQLVIFMGSVESLADATPSLAVK